MSPSVRILTLWVVLVCSAGAAQARTLVGRAIDADTGEPTAGAVISVEGAGAAAIADADGRFVIPGVAEAEVVVVVAGTGYAPWSRVVQAGTGDVDLGTVLLEADAGMVGGEVIVVTPGTFSMMGGPNPSQLTMKSDDLTNMSWAEDVTRAVARLPGISSSDYSSKFSIRGGDVDEVLFTLDGMELYEPFHQRDFSGGLFSIVDIETIDGVELNTGGFSATHGNRLSGMLNMHTKRRRSDHPHGSAAVSAMNARVYADSPFAGDRGFAMASVRRSMLDLLFRAVGADEIIPAYYDTLGVAEYKLGRKHTLSLHGLHAGDSTKVRDIAEDGNFDRNDTHYANSNLWLTLRSRHTERLFSDVMLYGTRLSQNRRGSFFKDELSDKGSFELSDQRTMYQLGLKQDWTLVASNTATFEAGLDLRHARADYGYHMQLDEIRVNSMGELYDYSNVVDLSPSPTGEQASAYLSGRFRLFRRLYAEPGLRFDHTSWANDRVWSPRIALAFVPVDGTVVRAAWGRYFQSQFIDTLDVNHADDQFHRAKRAQHYIVGAEHLFAPGVSARVEAYYKDLSRLPRSWTNLRDHLEMFPEQRNDNARIVYDGSTSKGIEVFLRYDPGGVFSAWLSYALASAVDEVRAIEFDGLLDARTGQVPRLNNQRHTVFADANYRPNPRWRFNVSWQYYVGWPRTDYTYLVQELPDARLHFYPQHLEYNGTEYPAYHRMDLRINRHFQVAGGRLSVFLHMINLYNRHNLKKFDLDTTNDNGDPSVDGNLDYIPVRDDAYWFGLLPAAGASYEVDF